ncbi:hypothetical protein D3C87_1880640 [compost metagenome]
MQLEGRFQPVMCGRDDVVKARFLHRRQNPFSPERRLERRHQFAPEEFGPGVAELVVLGEENAHGEGPEVSNEGR